MSTVYQGGKVRFATREDLKARKCGVPENGVHSRENTGFCSTCMVASGVRLATIEGLKSGNVEYRG